MFMILLKTTFESYSFTGSLIIASNERHNQSAVILQYSKNVHISIFLRYFMTQNLWTIHYVALLSLPPQKFAHSAGRFIDSMVVRNRKGGMSSNGMMSELSCMKFCHLVQHLLEESGCYIYEKSAENW